MSYRYHLTPIPNKFITSNNEIEYEKIENDRCITYISIENILNANIFFKSEKINIFIASDDNETLVEIVDIFCKF